MYETSKSEQFRSSSEGVKMTFAKNGAAAAAETQLAPKLTHQPRILQRTLALTASAEFTIKADSISLQPSIHIFSMRPTSANALMYSAEYHLDTIKAFPENPPAGVGFP